MKRAQRKLRKSDIADMNTGGRDGNVIPGAYLPPLIGTYKKKHAGISAQLGIDDTAKITEAVLTGSLRIGIAGARL